MNWLPLLHKVMQKPPLQVILPIMLFFVLILAKWQLSFPFAALWFFLGGVLGIYLIDIAEELFKLQPSPFRSLLFVVSLFILSFYIVTSTPEFLARGLSFSVYLSLFLLYATDWNEHHSTHSWFRMLFSNIPPVWEVRTLWGFALSVILIGWLFLIT